MNNYPYRPMQSNLPSISQPSMPMQSYSGPFQPTVAPSNNIKWVQGKAGANAYPVSAGETVQLMDTEESVFYIKSADYSGMPLPLRTFDYSERVQTIEDKDSYATRAEFNELKKQSDELKKKFEDLMGGDQ